ncbi:MAG TPA: GyrI-like domain-containing protein [Pseudobdellovibrionaceae bacterium]|jgi:AraC family transcriptional regulator
MPKLNHFELVLAAIDFIENNLKEEISIQEVCKEVPLSSWQFQRLFRALVGNSIGSYLRGRRLTLAAHMLADSKRILDIAIDLQFGSQEAFTRAFKAQYRITPGQIRNHPEYIKLYKKPRLTKDTLAHLQNGIQREPKICLLGPFNLLGKVTTITSFLGKNPDFESKLPGFWKEFNREKGAHSLNNNTESYGVAISSSQDMFEEELKYFAGIPVPAEREIPKEFVPLHMDEQLYAVFENKGLADKSQLTIDYIYGVWLPESGYQRARGFDFEIFDHRYSLDSSDSLSQYCIPIEKIS